jgi:7,8-dihydropterin-6-yl-methyl-4-(beta-D-ribofuranosyl)aminobenzene 5'-phosphate synthase
MDVLSDENDRMRENHMNAQETKITVLCENTVGVSSGIAGEWGLAMLVEKGGKRFLFDTGEQGRLVDNANALRIDLKDINALIISHGHYDHTGGLKAFLRLRGRLPVYAHPDIFTSRYTTFPRKKYIGIPNCREELISLGADFIFIKEPVEIEPGIWISGEVPRKTHFERENDRLLCSKNGICAPDPFYDDLSLYCVTPEGLVIILGCAHAGLVNIIKHARQVTGINRIYGITGGTHLGPAPPAQQKATIEFLTGLDLQFLAPNHCTGLPMMSRLAGLFGSRFRFAPAGTRFTLP